MEARVGTRLQPDPQTSNWDSSVIPATDPAPRAEPPPRGLSPAGFLAPVLPLGSHHRPIPLPAGPRAGDLGPRHSLPV